MVSSDDEGTKMTSKSPNPKKPAAQVVKDIRRATRRHFSAEDKIRIVLDGLRGEDSIAELCRKEGIAQSLYYTWSKEFMEAGECQDFRVWSGIMGKQGALYVSTQRPCNTE